MSSDIKQLTEQFLKFRDDRDWKQFHKPKDMAISLMLEAAELLELFQWKSDTAADEFIRSRPEALRDELVDVLCWVLTIAHDCDIDLLQATQEKIQKNVLKYPVEKAKGRNVKYTHL